MAFNPNEPQDGADVRADVLRNRNGESLVPSPASRFGKRA